MSKKLSSRVFKLTKTGKVRKAKKKPKKSEVALIKKVSRDMLETNIKELKFADSVIKDVYKLWTGTASYIWTHLTEIPVADGGVSEWGQRRGTKISMSNIKLKLNFRFLTTNSTDGMRHRDIRIMLVQDLTTPVTGTGTTFPAYTELFDTGTITTQQYYHTQLQKNYDNRKMYRILKDKTITWDPVTMQQFFATGYYTYRSINFDYTPKKPMEIEWERSDNAGAYDACFNPISLLVFTNNEYATAPDQYNFEYHLYYKDI